MYDESLLNTLKHFKNTLKHKGQILLTIAKHTFKCTSKVYKETVHSVSIKLQKQMNLKK